MALEYTGVAVEQSRVLSVYARYHVGRLRGRGSRPVNLLNEHAANIRELLSIRRVRSTSTPTSIQLY